MAKFDVEYKGASVQPKTIEANAYEVKEPFVNFYDKSGNLVYTVAVANVFSIRRVGD